MRAKRNPLWLVALLVAGCASSSSTPATSVSAAATGTVIAPAASASATTGPSQSALPAGSSASASAPASQPPALATVPLPDAPFRMAFDAKRNSLWIPVLNGPGSKLYEYQIATGKLASWPLPDTEHNGFLGSLLVAPDGAVWMADNYSLIRFTPKTGVVQSRKLPWKDADAVPDALTTNRSPGTWMSALFVDSQGRVVLGRHNVNALMYLNTIMRETGRVELPKQLGGVGTAMEKNGFLYVTPYMEGQMAIIDPAGHVTWGAEAVRSMASVGDEVVAVSWNGTRLAFRGATQVSSSAFQFTYVAGAKDSEIDYSEQVGRNVIQRSRDGVVLATYPLRSHPAEVYNPLGELVPVTIAESVQALAVDGGDHVWAVLSYQSTERGPSTVNLVELPI